MGASFWKRDLFRHYLSLCPFANLIRSCYCPGSLVVLGTVLLLGSLRQPLPVDWLLLRRAVEPCKVQYRLEVWWRLLVFQLHADAPELRSLFFLVVRLFLLYDWLWHTAACDFCSAMLGYIARLKALLIVRHHSRGGRRLFGICLFWRLEMLLALFLRGPIFLTLLSILTLLFLLISKSLDETSTLFTVFALCPALVTHHDDWSLLLGRGQFGPRYGFRCGLQSDRYLFGLLHYTKNIIVNKSI